MVSTVATRRSTPGHAATVGPDPRAASDGSGDDGERRRPAWRDGPGGNRALLPLVASPSPWATASLKQKTTKTRPRNSTTAGCVDASPAVSDPTQRLHQAGRLQQDQAADDVGSPDDRRSAAVAVQMPARGREPVGVDRVIEEHAGRRDGLAQEEQLGPGCRRLEDREGARETLRAVRRPARPETLPRRSDASRSARTSTTPPPRPPRWPGPGPSSRSRVVHDRPGRMSRPPGARSARRRRPG